MAWGGAGQTPEEEDGGSFEHILSRPASPTGWPWATCVFKGRQPRELVSPKGRVKSRVLLPPALTGEQFGRGKNLPSLGFPQ